MNIEKLVVGIGKATGKVLFKKKDDTAHIDISTANSSVDVFELMVRKMYSTEEYNECENYIFNQLHDNFNEKHYSIAKEFFLNLLSKSELELKSREYSIEEVELGLKDLEKLKNKNVHNRNI